MTEDHVFSDKAALLHDGTERRIEELGGVRHWRTSGCGSLNWPIKPDEPSGLLDFRCPHRCSVRRWLSARKGLGTIWFPKIQTQTKRFSLPMTMGNFQNSLRPYSPDVGTTSPQESQIEPHGSSVRVRVMRPRFSLRCCPGNRSNASRLLHRDYVPEGHARASTPSISKPCDLSGRESCKPDEAGHGVGSGDLAESRRNTVRWCLPRYWCRRAIPEGDFLSRNASSRSRINRSNGSWRVLEAHAVDAQRPRIP